MATRSSNRSSSAELRCHDVMAQASCGNERHTRLQPPPVHPAPTQLSHCIPQWRVSIVVGIWKERGMEKSGQVLISVSS